MKNLNNYKKKCHSINFKLSKSTLQFQTFGNVSQRIDRNHYVIKPSGINLNTVKSQQYPIIDLRNNKVVSGNLRPSSDTPTHSEIYKMNSAIKGITHAHSKYVTIWSQSLKKIPPLGTTHADYWGDYVPITKPLSKKEILNNYEKNTGIAILRLFKNNKMLDKCPGVLVANHGGFCWGDSAEKSFLNFERLEFIAELAYKTLQLNNKTKTSKNLINKHFFRKHGDKAYYGQK